MIWAQTASGVIGVNNTIPWHVPEDFKHFKETTNGHAVIMGRLTWESLPEKSRPLPGRKNIVISRQSNYVAPGAVVVTSADEAVLALEGSEGEAWVIGGSQIYSAFLGASSALVVTDIDLEVQGDAFAVTVDDSWVEADRSPSAGWHESRNGTRYRIRSLKRVD